MKNRLEGKTALITGATSGIGEATARHFAEMKTNLVITGRRENRLKKLSESLTNEYAIDVAIGAFDIRDRDACRQFVESLNEMQIDILVNNAGLSRGLDPVYNADFEDWDEMIDTNVKGLLTMTRLITPQMKERNSGHVINIGSTAGHEAYGGGSVYCATKHAVKAITKSTKLDLHGTNVRVSLISPGLVETEFSNVRFHGDDEKAANVYRGITPLTGNDIAEIVVFVANRPSHVNIMDTIVYTTNQSSATTVYRDE